MPMCPNKQCGFQYTEGPNTLYSKDYMKTPDKPYKILRLLPGKDKCVRGFINKCEGCGQPFYWKQPFAVEVAKSRRGENLVQAGCTVAG